MNISFHGIKNAGAYMYRQEKEERTKQGAHIMIEPAGKHINLHLELNNEGETDLDDFRYILKAFPNKFNPNSLNIDYDEFINPNTGKQTKIYAINDEILDVNKQTFPVFNQIFKLLKRIEHMPENTLKVENQYLQSEEAKNAFRYYEAPLKNQNKAHGKTKTFEQLLDEVHTQEYAQKGAKVLSKRFANALTQYVSF